MTRSRNWVYLDKLKRRFFLKYELKRVLIKSLSKNSSLPLSYRYLVFYQKLKFARWSILPQVVNRCSRTGRALSVTKHTKYSRFVFRNFSYNGDLPGYRRASW